jgi:hypothetical protein
MGSVQRCPRRIDSSVILHTGCHDRRSDRSSAPVGVGGFEEDGGGGDVRARHGRPRHDVVLHHAVVAVELRRGRRLAPRRHDVQPGCRDVRLR